jgi:CHAT domain-containing protein
MLVDRQRVQIVDVGHAAELHAHAETLRSNLRELGGRSAQQRTEIAARALGAALLPPSIRAQLVGVERLIVITEGALQYVPFASLTLPQELSPQREPWITRFDLVYAPSAMTLLELRERAQRRAKATKTIAVMADPVFSDPNEPCIDDKRRLVGPKLIDATLRGFDPSRDALSQAALEVGQIRLARLCHSLDEAGALRELVPDPSERLEFVGHEATRAAARTGRLRDYRVLHFATHGFMPPGAPELGGLVLSRFDARRQPLDAFLTAADIGRLPLQSELVVLSACRTGLGREVRGEGFLGLAQAFMAAGATQVLASLWSVRDEATARLMRLFYERLAQGADAARALRQAQVALSREPAHADPFFWAGFVLHGDGGPVELRHQTTPLSAGLSQHTGRAASARREETAMQDRHAGSASGQAAKAPQHPVRADGPHTPGPPGPGPKPDGTLGPDSNATSQTPPTQGPPGGKSTGDILGDEWNATSQTPKTQGPPVKSDGTTLGEPWLAATRGRRHDDANPGTPRPPTPEEKAASNDPAVKVLGDPFDAR